MSNHANHRRGLDHNLQDHGPTWESHTPAAGCNSTHVARSRTKWKRRNAKALRRTGETLSKFNGGKVIKKEGRDA
jgi:hypothetical protein